MDRDDRLGRSWIHLRRARQPLSFVGSHRHPVRHDAHAFHPVGKHPVSLVPREDHEAKWCVDELKTQKDPPWQSPPLHCLKGRVQRSLPLPLLRRTLQHLSQPALAFRGDSHCPSPTLCLCFLHVLPSNSGNLRRHAASGLRGFSPRWTATEDLRTSIQGNAQPQPCESLLLRRRQAHG